MVALNFENHLKMYIFSARDPRIPRQGSSERHRHHVHRHPRGGPRLRPPLGQEAQEGAGGREQEGGQQQAHGGMKQLIGPRSKNSIKFAPARHVCV